MRLANIIEQLYGRKLVQELQLTHQEGRTLMKGFDTLGNTRDMHAFRMFGGRRLGRPIPRIHVERNIHPERALYLIDTVVEFDSFSDPACEYRVYQGDNTASHHLYLDEKRTQHIGMGVSYISPPKNLHIYWKTPIPEQGLVIDI